MEENVLERLCVEILRELEQTRKSYTVFADLCGISRNLMGSIVNRKKSDIKVSTIARICENSNIQIENIFCDYDIEKISSNAILIINGKRYTLELKEYK